MTACTRFRRVPPLALAVVLLTALACGKKGGEAASEASTSTIQAAPDDIVPERATVEADSTSGAPISPVAAPSQPTPSQRTATGQGSSIIGHDSAFGPMYELDSAGRAIPLKRRKP